jgi:hypothetical protein
LETGMNKGLNRFAIRRLRDVLLDHRWSVGYEPRRRAGKIVLTLRTFKVLPAPVSRESQAAAEIIPTPAGMLH